MITLLVILLVLYLCGNRTMESMGRAILGLVMKIILLVLSAPVVFGILLALFLLFLLLAMVSGM